MRHTSALGPVGRALKARLFEYAGLTAILRGDRVYSRLVPETIVDETGSEVETPFPYLVVGSRGESDFDTFGTPGNEGAIDVHIWSATVGDSELDAIYKQMREALSEPLALDEGGVMLSGRLRYVTDALDVDGPTPVMHAVTRYSTLARVPTNG